jgi:hypothetical protein
MWRTRIKSDLIYLFELKLEALLKSKKPAQPQDNPPMHTNSHIKWAKKKPPPLPLFSSKEKNQVAQIVDFLCLLK